MIEFLVVSVLGLLGLFLLVILPLAILIGIFKLILFVVVDGWSLVVEQSFVLGEPGYTETWTFDDPATEHAPDQVCSMTYAADGSGTGTLTTFFAEGESQTCVMEVTVEGETTLDCGPPTFRSF